MWRQRLSCDGESSQSGAANTPQRLGRFDDVDALMAAQRQQMLAIPGDDQIGARRLADQVRRLAADGRVSTSASSSSSAGLL